MRQPLPPAAQPGDRVHARAGHREVCAGPGAAHAGLQPLGAAGALGGHQRAHARLAGQEAHHRARAGRRSGFCLSVRLETLTWGCGRSCAPGWPRSRQPRPRRSALRFLPERRVRCPPLGVVCHGLLVKQLCVSGKTLYFAGWIRPHPPDTYRLGAHAQASAPADMACGLGTGLLVSTHVNW